ncbi:MAG TPA: TerB family tellurite resistance protein [Thiobacillaceae bacterium]|nr:TerB family tellurite resistance protein [Thiobacillaceae bacterium]
MNPEQQRALLAIALFAAFADGEKHDRERDEIRRITDSLAGEAGAPGLAGIYQDVLLKRLRLEAAAAALSDTGERQLAYEMAVGVCEADGGLSDTEHRFLGELKSLLRLDASPVELIEGEAAAIVELSQAAAPGPVVAAQAGVSDTELDKAILNASLLNGALELLPQSWASMAIIPLQIKMVYGIGKAHGVSLDQGHIKEFIAAAGVGLTSQYLEQIGRKLIGGLLGKAAGKTFGKVGSAAAGMAFSFATTYALGQLAKRYYAGGRRMDTALLRDTFQNLLGPAKQMQTQYLPQIRQQAETLDMGRVMAMVRGT